MRPGLARQIRNSHVGRRLGWALLAVSGCVGPFAGPAGRDEASPPPSAVGLSAARFQVTIFQVKAHPANAGDLTAAALSARAKTSAELQAALEAVGRVETLYQLDQDIRVRVEERIRVGSQAPVVVAVRESATAPAVSAVEYRDVGADFRVRVEPPGPDAPAPSRVGLRLTIDLTIVSDEVSTATAPAADAIRAVRLAWDEPADLLRPVVLSVVEAPPPEGADSVVAHVAWVVIAPPVGF